MGLALEVTRESFYSHYQNYAPVCSAYTIIRSSNCRRIHGLYMSFLQVSSYSIEAHVEFRKKYQWKSLALMYYCANNAQKKSISEQASTFNYAFKLRFALGTQSDCPCKLKQAVQRQSYACRGEESRNSVCGGCSFHPATRIQRGPDQGHRLESHPAHSPFC